MFGPTLSRIDSAIVLARTVHGLSARSDRQLYCRTNATFPSCRRTQNCAQQSLASTLSAPVVAATSCCHPSQFDANVVTPCCTLRSLIVYVLELYTCPWSCTGRSLTTWGGNGRVCSQGVNLSKFSESLGQHCRVQTHWRIRAIFYELCTIVHKNITYIRNVFSELFFLPGHSYNYTKNSREKL